MLLFPSLFKISKNLYFLSVSVMCILYIYLLSVFVICICYFICYLWYLIFLLVFFGTGDTDIVGILPDAHLSINWLSSNFSALHWGSKYYLTQTVDGWVSWREWKSLDANNGMMWGFKIYLTFTDIQICIHMYLSLMKILMITN